MAIITWGPSLEVGFGDIDVQHRRLVALLNQLDQSASSHSPRASTQAILSELTAYTQVHFAYEERLMEHHGLAGADRSEAHRQEHRDLVAQVTTFVDRYAAGDVDLDEELLYFLRDWLSTHILGTDRGLAQSLREAGATSAS